jgi:phosphoribosylformylglycinamidine synthase
MCVGLIETERLIRSAASGPGNLLVLFGASTGRDGIGGASVLASAELGEGDDAKRPSVQIGDPFAEKKLMECSLELLERGLLVALQDLGAAGLTSAASEMASKGGVGIDIDVSQVPLRERGMAPFEIMVSESQERMLCVVAPESLEAVIAVCEHWETTATRIGEVTASGLVRIFDGGTPVGEMPVAALVDECPVYELDPRPPSEPLYPAPERVLVSEDAGEALLALLRSPNIADRRPLFEQYDWIVQSRTVRRPGQADAAVLALPERDGSSPGIAISIDGNGRRVAADPYRGSVEAVLECAANLACVGAEPLGLTNCLNFGNPEKPHIAWQLAECVRGLGDACRALGIPVVGGNVSLYNEGADGPIYPTPVVGLVGELPDVHRAGRLGFRAEGDRIALVGVFSPEIRGSELARLGGTELPSALADCDIARVRATQQAVRDAVRCGALSSAHDIAEGGLATALAECCLASGLGAEVVLADTVKPLRALFGEAPGGFVVTGDDSELRALADDIELQIVGAVSGNQLTIVAGEARIELSLELLREAHGSLGVLFE